jgi:pilus assembly protein Flp/PilA
MPEMSAESEPTASTAQPTPGAKRGRLRRLATDRDGATAIEYALIASGIGAAVAATVWSLGTTTANFYQSLADLF